MALGIIPSLFRVLNSVKNKIKNYFACNAVTFGLISLIPAQEQMNNQKISCFEKRRHSVLRMSSFYHFLLQFDLQPEQPQEHPPPHFLRE